MSKDKAPWLQELKKVTQLPQTQEALNDQLRKLRVIANKFGLYDAADYLRPAEPQKWELCEECGHQIKGFSGCMCY